jgi:hypothetical protein
MTEGNPQVTDLSDPNRPMKLAERFGEMYDACWTDVLEEFMIHHSKGTDEEEKKAIDGMKCLLEVYLNNTHLELALRNNDYQCFIIDVGNNI